MANMATLADCDAAAKTGEMSRNAIHTEHAPSYYAATANRKTPRDVLAGEVRADICIVGAGYTGLSAALALAENKYDVAVVEANLIGWGASGRNGGQIVNGLNASLQKIKRQFGQGPADFVGRLVQEGGSIIKRRIETYGIDCDFRPGNLFAAFTSAHMKGLEEKQLLWRAYGMDDHEMLDRRQIREHVASEAYAGGMIDHSGAHIHPLNLALGEADAIEKLGGRIFEQSAVTQYEKSGAEFIVRTGRGAVRCKSVVFCGNAYLQGVAPDIERRVLPVSTQIVTTESLGKERATALLPTNLCVEDVRYILDYYRLTADNRLLFGGGTVYGGADPADVRAKLWPNLLKVFPQLSDVKLDFAWSGNFALSYSRVPQLGRLDDGVYFAHGYSGHGITGSHLFGKILAEAIDGDASRFDVFASLPYFEFPGGRALRVPYSVIGSWWYGLRDRLGV